ncbi:hypothetical protein MSG37_07165 [Shewanella sp. 1CM18E]|uniref:hypothetical protein n=1 Tax=Shewanella sp. 1CM18E TaxID=2929169 RepID=UPI0020C02C2B|nr:hypothetical protein [Shewanella sp. 1CM18E]MCK8044660.1 hypothetical protein [Shewanella sp. 1CM18E]
MQLFVQRFIRFSYLVELKLVLVKYWQAEVEQSQLAEISKGICEAHSLWQA